MVKKNKMMIADAGEGGRGGGEGEVEVAECGLFCA